MKYHWSVKMVALILVALSVATLALGGLSILVNVSHDLYRQDLDTVVAQRSQDMLENYCVEAARIALAQYLMEKNTQPNTPERVIWENHFNSGYIFRDPWPQFEYVISATKGSEPLASTRKEELQYNYSTGVVMDINDGTIVKLGRGKKFLHYDERPANYRWSDYQGNPLPDLDSRTFYYDLVEYGQDTYRVEYFDNPCYYVEIFLTEQDTQVLYDQLSEKEVLTAAYRLRWYDIAIAVVSALVAVAGIVYLCFAAGKAPGSDQCSPRGTNRLWLDVFAAGAVSLVIFGAWLGSQVLQEMVYESGADLMLLLVCFAACAAGMGLVATLFAMALCAQIRSRIWLRNTLIGRCLILLGRLLVKLIRLVKGLLAKPIRWLRGMVKGLPLVWQWVAVFGALMMLNYLAALIIYHSILPAIIVLAVGFVLVVYSGYAISALRDGAKRMSRGELNIKIDPKKEWIYGNFAEFAQDLNALSDACTQAAMEKMQSERMKSELITNVSHDIKTPLTSIINYVDLLSRAEDETQRQEYLQVLSRQSQRLKKLIEDLIEMSKANSGNIAAEVSRTDVVEAVNQALGEFADRLDEQNLRTLVRSDEQMMYAMCDGRLLWRVLSNLLVNVVKYAMPGTRVYVEVTQSNAAVCITLKNICAEPLNVSAEELMERFVRGDSSRTDQGNGLGLNIAKGLMQVQEGTLDVTVDGDLFKVVLMLPKCS